MIDRIRTGNTEEFIKSRILDGAINQNDSSSRILYPGIVINNVDPKNANRIQVRIPFVDDNTYIGRTKDDADKLLPWCSPFSRNFIGTPEQNSIVLVAIFDPKTPNWGRMYFDSVTDLNSTNIFDPTRLVPETTTYNNWINFEQTYNISLKSKPNPANQYNSGVKVDYLVGLRGKGKNSLQMDQTSVSLSQNEGDAANLSLLRLTTDINIIASDKLNLLSTKGGTKYHPVFDTPLYQQLSRMNEMMKAIVVVMNSTPALMPNGNPCIPSPSANNLIQQLTNVYLSMDNLKNPGVGASKQLTIN